MACGCGCNGAPDGCGDGAVQVSGLGEISYPFENYVNAVPLIVIGSLLYFFWWRK